MNLPGSMTHCPDEDLVLDYVAGRLDEARAVSFRRHAETCAHCTSLCTAQSAIWKSLDEWTAAPVSQGFNRELWKKIDGGGQAQWKHHLAFWKQLAPLAAATALIVTAFVFDHSGKDAVRPHPVANSAAVIVTASEADQLEQALDDIQLLHEADAASAPVRPGVM